YWNNNFMTSLIVSSVFDQACYTAFIHGEISNGPYAKEIKTYTRRQSSPRGIFKRQYGPFKIICGRFRVSVGRRFLNVERIQFAIERLSETVDKKIFASSRKTDHGSFSCRQTDEIV
ncbi:13192_t:CDS:1, partial [Ambispora gerdemannii]